MLANIAGDWYWIVIAVIVLFGGSQLPKLARNAGEAMNEFKKGHNEAMSSSSGAATPPVALGPATAVAPASPPPAEVPGASSANAGEERVTLTRAELDALLAHREAQAKAAMTPPPAS